MRKLLEAEDGRVVYWQSRICDRGLARIPVALERKCLHANESLYKQNLLYKQRISMVAYHESLL